MRTANHPSPISRLKRLLVPAGKSPRKILLGPFRGIRMNLDLSFQTQLYMGLAEAELNAALYTLSKDIRSAVNIGAAYGEQTLFFLKKTPAETVLSFEPDGTVREQLLDNLKLNYLEQTPRLRLSSKFVGSQNTSQMCSLDSIALSLPKPCLVQMDVEGYEVDVLRGAGNFLNQPSVRWIIETHSEALEQTSRQILQQAGYDTKIVPNAWWRIFLSELRPKLQNRWLIAVPFFRMAPRSELGPNLLKSRSARPSGVRTSFRRPRLQT